MVACVSCREVRAYMGVWRCRGVAVQRCGGASGRGVVVHDTPDEDSPYPPRNPLKEEEEAKPATHDMPEIPYFIPVILPYFIPVIRR